MPQEPLFSEAEASEIVKRAVELNEQDKTDYKPGVTQSELEQIAREVGVDVQCLQRAISEHLAGKPISKEGFRFIQEYERVVDGELATEDFDIVVSELPMSANQTAPAQVGRSLTAKVMNGLVLSDVKVTARNGRTRVKVRSIPLLSTIFGAQALMFGTIFGAVMIGDKGLIGTGLAVIGTAAAAAYGLFVGGTRLGQKAARSMADRLTRAIAEQTESEDVRDRLRDSVSDDMDENVRNEIKQET